jgi:K+-transporting ATPase KdpF subunit
MQISHRHTSLPIEFSLPSAARRAPLKGAFMTFDLALAGLVALGLLVYLVMVLLQPERF